MPDLSDETHLRQMDGQELSKVQITIGTIPFIMNFSHSSVDQICQGLGTMTTYCVLYDNTDFFFSIKDATTQFLISVAGVQCPF